MNRMLRAVIVTVLISVATVKIIKCEDADCLEKNPQKTIDMVLDYDALLKGKTIEKKFTKGENNAPFDSQFTFSYNEQKAQFEVQSCIRVPEGTNDKFIGDIIKRYYPLDLEIVSPDPVHKKCRNINIMNKRSIGYYSPFEDKVPSPCKAIEFPSKTLINHKKYFVSGSNMLVKAKYFPSLPECKDEYLKSESAFDWEIHPYSQIKWNLKKKILNEYYSPVIYSSPNAYRIMIYMNIEIGQDGEDTVKIGSHELAGPFTNDVGYEIEVAIPNDTSQPMQIMKENSPVTFKVKKDIINGDTLKIKMQINEQWASYH